MHIKYLIRKKSFKITFEIGVWDPADGMKFMTEQQQQNLNESSIITPYVLNGMIPKNGIKMNSRRADEISELIAVGNDTNIHNYDISDEENDDYDNFTFLMHNKMTSTFLIIIYILIAFESLQPMMIEFIFIKGLELGDVVCRDDVHADGWNEDIACNNIEINNENLPLVLYRIF